MPHTSDAEEDSAEKRLKIVLVGDSGAGKVSVRVCVWVRLRRGSRDPSEEELQRREE